MQKNNFSTHSLSLARSKNKKTVFLLLGFLIFLLANYSFSQNQPAAVYKLVKLAEFVLLGIYIVKNRLTPSAFYLLLSASIIYSSILAIAQFLKQGSMGGIFYWLGERTFNSGTPGIAQTIINGELILRPYATFPHPNVLAGFLVIGLLLLIHGQCVIPSEVEGSYISALMKKISPLPAVGRNDKNKILYLLAFILGTMALFLTFSHVAWIVFGGFLVYKLFRSLGFFHRSLVLGGIIIILLLYTLYFILNTFPIQPESFTYRQDLNLAAVKMWLSSPLIGIGLNNFLVRLPEFYRFPGPVYFLQPAHNIFLMILAETGLIGLMGVMGFLFLAIRRLILNTKYIILMALGAILALGLFDHYFYTLQQGQLIITVVLGLVWSDKNI